MRALGGVRVGAERRMPDFRSLVGDAAWAELPAAVQARFDAAAHERPRVYPGVMEVRASRFGRLIAQLCRLVGTPLAPWRGRDVSVAVLTWPAAAGGLVWDRTYAFEGHQPITITSTKLMTKNGRLLEVALGGLGMRLATSVEAGALVFRSRGYFWRVAGLRLPIPAWLTPGAALVIHHDQGGGAFTFSMRFVHALAGETLFQEGRFRDPAARMLEASVAPAGGAEPLGRAA
jgi:hypothetical protein